MKKNLISILLVILIISVMVAIGLLIKINNNIEKNSNINREVILSENETSDKNDKDDKNNKNDADELDEDEAKKLAGSSIKKYCNVAGFEDSDIKGMPVILEKLGFISRDEISDGIDTSKGTPYGRYYKTSVKYEAFKEKMLEMMTEEYFENNFSGYIDIEGYVGVVLEGIGMEPVDFESVESIEYIGNNKYICKAKMKDVALFDYGYTEDELSDEELYFSWSVELEKVNDKLLISDFVE